MDLQRAREAQRAVHYEAALRAARSALEVGDATPEQLWEIHALLGELSATMGDGANAVRHFEAALALNPSYQLAPGASPRLTEPLAQARRGSARAVGATADSTRTGSTVKTSVRVENDDLHLVQAGRLTLGLGESISMEKSRDGYAATWTCSTPECHAVARLMDEWGNGVLTVEETVGPALAPPTPEASPAAPVRPELSATAHGRRWYQRSGPWLVAAGAGLIATSSYFAAKAAADHQALMTENANRAQFTYPAAQSLQSSVNREQAYMWVGFGAAAACGIAAAFTW
jgi:hypothetical protein